MERQSRQWPNEKQLNDFDVQFQSLLESIRLDHHKRILNKIQNLRSWLDALEAYELERETDTPSACGKR